MVAWLYFVQSNGEYHDLMSFLLDGKDFSGISYLIFSEDVRSTDDRVFHSFGGFLLTVNFLSHASDIEVRLDEVGLDSSSLVDLHKIVCEDKNPLTKAVTITENAENFIFDKELEKFVTNNHFKFVDNSALTIPLVSRKRRL